MLLPVPQRQGVKTRQIYYRELDTAPGVDPASPVGYVLPLADEAAFGTTANLVKAPVYKGNRLPDGAITGNIMADGENPYGLEFRTFPRILKDVVGADGYSRVGSLHRFVIPTNDDAIMGTAQLQDESLEATKQILRNKGVRPGTINLSYATEGVARYGIGWMGLGDEVRTDLGGTVTDEGYSAVSYFNGSAKLDGYFLVGMTEFSISIDGGLSRQDAAFRAGIAAAINYGKINVSGKLGLMFSTDGSAPENNMNFYDYAVNNNIIPLEIVWANNPLELATMWCRIVLASTKWSRKGVRPGGDKGKFITQDFNLVNDVSADIAAEKFNTIAGPTYTLTTANKLGVKLNGGATIPITLGTASTTITLTAAVAALNANGTFAAGATAEEWHGRIMIRTLATGTTSSVQIDTAQVDSAHTILGFDGVVSTGFSDTPFLIEVYNDISADL